MTNPLLSVNKQLKSIINELLLIEELGHLGLDLHLFLIFLVLHGLQLSAHSFETVVENHLFLKGLQGGLALLVDQVCLGPELEQVLHNQVVAIASGKVHWGVAHMGCDVVHILALTDHNADHVKVAIFACLPDIYKKVIFL